MLSYIVYNDKDENDDEFDSYLDNDIFSYGKSHLDNIAKLGGTIKSFTENSFKGLDNAFQSIAINPSFGLKLK